MGRPKGSKNKTRKGVPIITEAENVEEIFLNDAESEEETKQI